MKKIAIFAGLATTLGVLPAAHAQSSVNLYGLMDAGLVQEGGVSKLTSGISAGSRLGLRGTPAFYVNGVYADVSFGLQHLHEAIDRALSGAS